MKYTNLLKNVREEDFQVARSNKNLYTTKNKKDKGKKQEKKKHDICHNAPLPQRLSPSILYSTLIAPGGVATTFLNYFLSRVQK